MKPQLDMGGEAVNFELPTFQLNEIQLGWIRPVLR